MKQVSESQGSLTLKDKVMNEEIIPIGDFWLNEIRIKQHPQGWCYGISENHKTGGRCFNAEYYPPHTPIFDTRKKAVIAGLKCYIDGVERDIVWHMKANEKSNVIYLNRLLTEAKRILLQYEETFKDKNGDVWIQLNLFE